jgi:hypothetical protein
MIVLPQLLLPMQRGPAPPPPRIDLPPAACRLVHPPAPLPTHPLASPPDIFALYRARSLPWEALPALSGATSGITRCFSLALLRHLMEAAPAGPAAASRDEGEAVVADYGRMAYVVDPLCEASDASRAPGESGGGGLAVLGGTGGEAGLSW